ncbi:TetR/AcrR family transcriptional regulator [Curtobacterium sp. S6]|uniref:TetR/AcrR family transcriptional regulator n=1 Tax=Curtobacterium sp. S6 TaxID=1479623 RepID=UPI0004AB8CAD|nr:TetR/AcrR family transcriptional regulator [Curtobacterium sp. S6]
MPPTQQRAVERRTHIIATAVDVVAEVGYHQASFAKIVERGGLSSPRLISYHFTNREALMTEALAYVVEQAQAHMHPRIAAAMTVQEKLAAYILGNLDFLETNPTCAIAAVQIVANLPRAEGDQTQGDTSVRLLEQLFTDGQAAGEMRHFDNRVMAVTLRAAIDAAATGIDRANLAHHAEELVEIFRLATTVEVQS